MDGRFGGKPHNLYGPVVSDLKTVGKKSLEWDLNDWKWDGDLFTANPVNPLPSDCRSRQLFPIGPEIGTKGNANNSSSSDEVNAVNNSKGKRELDKRRRVTVVEDEELNGEEAGSLNLKLGGHVYPVTDGDAKSGKKTKIAATPSNRALCQVEDCKTDLSSAKDYHRRHKVCDMHSKASKALVGNVMQRFCQQCSRFHVLQEFDEGKRSCRRRLAGHNKRRRKTHPENITNGASLPDERSSSYLLISLLRILSNMHSNNTDQSNDQDLLSHLLKNLATLAGSSNGENLSGLLRESQGLLSTGTSLGKLNKVTDVALNGPEAARTSSAPGFDYPIVFRPAGQCGSKPASDLAEKRKLASDVQDQSINPLSGPPPKLQFQSRDSLPVKVNEKEATASRMRMNNIDLNNVYDDSLDYGENLENSHPLVTPGLCSANKSLWLHPDSNKSSPPEFSRNSDSTSSQSPSTSSGEAQSRTDRIVFKLFGKDPSDFPAVLRREILDWLSHSPTDIESYIRPGCIVLTIYLRLGKSTWDEIYFDLGSSLRKLLDASRDSLWRTGWVYARVQHCVAFVYNGQVVLDTPLPLKSHKNCRITSIRPIALPVSGRTQFVVKGFNLYRSTTRLFCALEGRYLVQETCSDLMDSNDASSEHDELQFLTFSCSIPNVSGRGFIEVEDYGLSSSFFPFIVAEEDVCSEICMLEGVIEIVESDDNNQKRAEKIESKNQALDFMHEMGWLLHRNHLKFRLGHLDPNPELFSFKRFKWLMEFSLDHDWCAVVKKLLSIFFNGTVDSGNHSSIKLALLDMCLLHRAVHRNCRPMVELLLRYVPDKELEKPRSEQMQHVDSVLEDLMFKPNVVGPAGLTPLHVAASAAGSENILDALTDDPGSVGIEAWKTARDSTGLTPNDYACMRGHYSYIHLVQRKISKKSESGHVVLNIPNTFMDCKPSEGLKPAKFTSLDSIEAKAAQRHCRLCEQKLAYGTSRTSLVYRPVMLSMVAIAAVCVCVALLFKSSPEVLCVFRPFRWELLEYGAS